MPGELRALIGTPLWIDVVVIKLPPPSDTAWEIWALLFGCGGGQGSRLDEAWGGGNDDGQAELCRVGATREVRLADYSRRLSAPSMHVTSTCDLSESRVWGNSGGGAVGAPRSTLDRQAQAHPVARETNADFHPRQLHPSHSLTSPASAIPPPPFTRLVDQRSKFSQ